MKTHVAVQARVRVRLSVLLDEALDRAVGFASRWAFKHDSTPITTADALVARLEENLQSEFWAALDGLGVEVD